MTQSTSAIEAHNGVIGQEILLGRTRNARSAGGAKQRPKADDSVHLSATMTTICAIERTTYGIDHAAWPTSWDGNRIGDIG